MKKKAIIILMFLVFAGALTFAEQADPNPGKTILEYVKKMESKWSEALKTMEKNKAFSEDAMEPIWSLYESGSLKSFRNEGSEKLSAMLDLDKGSLEIDKTIAEYWKDNDSFYPLIKDLLGAYSKAEINRYLDWMEMIKDDLEEVRGIEAGDLADGVKDINWMFAKLVSWLEKPSGKNTPDDALDCLLEGAHATVEVMRVKLQIKSNKKFYRWRPDHFVGIAHAWAKNNKLMDRKTVDGLHAFLLMYDKKGVELRSINKEDPDWRKKAGALLDEIDKEIISLMKKAPKEENLLPNTATPKDTFLTLRKAINANDKALFKECVTKKFIEENMATDKKMEEFMKNPECKAIFNSDDIEIKMFDGENQALINIRYIWQNEEKTESEPMVFVDGKWLLGK